MPFELEDVWLNSRDGREMTVDRIDPVNVVVWVGDRLPTAEDVIRLVRADH